MPGWDPFVGLTLVVLLLLLALARLSQTALDADPLEDRSTHEVRSPESGTASVPDADRRTDAAAVRDRAETPPDGRADPDRAGREPPAREARDLELTTSALLANVALTQGLFGALLVAGALYFRIPARALGLGGARSGLAAVAIGVAFGVALWLASELAARLADAVGVAYDEQLRETLAPDSLAGWAVLLGVVLPVIAAVEELLFRAALIGVPAAGYGLSPWALAIVSSGAFAVGHGAQGRVGIAVTGGLGFLLAAGYVLSGSLLVVAVAHYLVNALEFLVHELDPLE